MTYSFQNLNPQGGNAYRDSNYILRIFRIGYETEDSRETLEEEGYIDWELNHNADANGDTTLQNGTELDAYSSTWMQRYIVDVDDVAQTVRLVRRTG